MRSDRITDALIRVRPETLRSSLHKGPAVTRDAGSDVKKVSLRKARKRPQNLEALIQRLLKTSWAGRFFLAQLTAGCRMAGRALVSGRFVSGYAIRGTFNI